MAESPQFQMIPQMVPIYQPQLSPPQPFPMPGQPIFSIRPPPPSHYGFPPMAWSPVHHFSPQPLPFAQPTYNQTDDDGDFNAYQAQSGNENDQDNDHNNNNNNVDLAHDSQNEPQHFSPRPNRFATTYSTTNKFDTRYEEFRKYLEEMGILSAFTNILTEMYQDPLRPSDPMGYVRDQLGCSRPDTIELSNLRLWCEQYHMKTLRLEKELEHVIGRLRKYEPYITDKHLFDNKPLYDKSSSKNDSKLYESDVAKQGQTWGGNDNYKSVENKN